jgi:hypothetical protein
LTAENYFDSRVAEPTYQDRMKLILKLMLKNKILRMRLMEVGKIMRRSSRLRIMTKTNDHE